MRTPKPTLGATRVAVFQSVTTELVAVTAEAAGSSPIAPATSLLAGQLPNSFRPLTMALKC